MVGFEATERKDNSNMLFQILRESEKALGFWFQREGREREKREREVGLPDLNRPVMDRLIRFDRKGGVRQRIYVRERAKMRLITCDG